MNGGLHMLVFKLLALGVAGAAAANVGSGKSALRTKTRILDSFAPTPADLVAKQGADNLLHLLAEDERKSHDETATIGFDAFLPQCLAHTEKLIHTIDRSYTDYNLQTVLQNECLLSKEFPRVHNHGFDDYEACMDFAESLTKARREELLDGSTSGYRSFCEKFYVHKGGSLPGHKDDVKKSDTIGRGASWVFPLALLMPFLSLVS